MSITLTLPLELEQRILGRAAETKKPVEEVAIGLIAQGLEAEKPMLTIDEILAPFRQEVAASGIADEALDTFQTLDPQNEAMLAVLARSAERQKNMPVGGETRDTLEMIRHARDGEMWGTNPALQSFLQAMAAGAANAPVLPPSANERAFYYEGHE